MPFTIEKTVLERACSVTLVSTKYTGVSIILLSLIAIPAVLATQKWSQDSSTLHRTSPIYRLLYHADCRLT